MILVRKASVWHATKIAIIYLPSDRVGSRTCTNVNDKHNNTALLNKRVSHKTTLLGLSRRGWGCAHQHKIASFAPLKLQKNAANSPIDAQAQKKGSDFTGYPPSIHANETNKQPSPYKQPLESKHHQIPTSESVHARGRTLNSRPAQARKEKERSGKLFGLPWIVLPLD